MRNAVIVYWRDAEVDVGWERASSSEDREAPLITSLGFILKRTKKEIVLAADVSKDDTNRRIVIPASWIDRIVKLPATLFARSVGS